MHWSFMAMKRLARLTRIAAAALALGVSLSAIADAQMSNGVATLPKGGARQGVITPTRPAAPAVVPANPSFPPALFAPITIVPAQPVAFTLVPAVVMSDGSIFANFGFGFEPVLRSCSAGAGTVVVSGAQPRRISSNGASIPSRTAPSQPSQQTVTLSAAAQGGCFTRDQFGRVFVYRRN
jgi:hypothetical protein